MLKDESVSLKLVVIISSKLPFSFNKAKRTPPLVRSSKSALIGVAIVLNSEIVSFKPVSYTHLQIVLFCVHQFVVDQFCVQSVGKFEVQDSLSVLQIIAALRVLIPILPSGVSHSEHLLLIYVCSLTTSDCFTLLLYDVQDVQVDTLAIFLDQKEPQLELSKMVPLLQFAKLSCQLVEPSIWLSRPLKSNLFLSTQGNKDCKEIVLDHLSVIEHKGLDCAALYCPLKTTIPINKTCLLYTSRCV